MGEVGEPEPTQPLVEVAPMLKRDLEYLLTCLMQDIPHAETKD